MNGYRLPQNWQPTESQKVWAKGRRPELDIADQIEQFKDYWCAKAGKDATKLDWDATWRNWIRRAWAPARPVTASPSFIPAGSTRRLSDDQRKQTLGQYLPDILRQVGIKP